MDEGQSLWMGMRMGWPKRSKSGGWGGVTYRGWETVRREHGSRAYGDETGEARGTRQSEIEKRKKR